MEHHSNIVPWFLHKVKVKYIPVKKDGTLDLQKFEELLQRKQSL